MTTPRHSLIQRVLPVGLALVLNGALCLALLRLAVSTVTPETEIAVELQAPPQEVAAALPPPPPRIRKLQQQAEEIIERERTAPKPAPSPIRQLFTPPAPPPITDEQPPAEVKPPEHPVAVVETPPPPPAVMVPDTPGAGNLAPKAGDATGGNPGGHTPGPGTGAGTSTGTGPGTGGSTPGGTSAPPGGPGPGAAPGGGNPGNATGPVTTATPGGTKNPPGDGHAGVTPTGGGNPPPAPPAAAKGISRKGYAKTAPQPAYPPEARDDGIQGAVRLRVAIDENGRLVGEPVVIKSSGNRALDKAAQRGVKKWSFEPELDDGKPVASTLVVEVQFTLK